MHTHHDRHLSRRTFSLVSPLSPFPLGVGQTLPSGRTIPRTTAIEGQAIGGQAIVRRYIDEYTNPTLGRCQLTIRESVISATF